MSFRVTTNGTLRQYRSNLNANRKRLNTSMTRVLTQRQFNSYAEDPGAASRAFQIRRSMWKNDAQTSNTNAVFGTYSAAFTAVDGICDGTGMDDPGLSGMVDALRGITDTTGSARLTLAEDLKSKSEAMVKAMNVQYGDSFVFAGTDGLNAPFAWDNGKLTYRGIDVNTTDSDELKQLETMAKETAYVDIGLGYQEDENGNIIPTSAFNGVLSGLNVLGYGQDKDGDSENLAVLMKELGDIFARCDEDSGDFATDKDRDDADRLTGKIIDAVADISEQHTKIAADALYLNTNLEQLKDTRDNLEIQREEIEAVDPAMAISEMAYANYCYSAALKIGNQVLSQSLLDYLQ